MTFVITNGFEQHLTRLIHTFEPRLTVNEQLPLIEKKTGFDLQTYFPFIYKLPYGIHKINHHFDSKDFSNLFFILNVHKFVVLQSFDKEFPLMLDLCKEHFSDIKIVFAPTTYMLQEYINTLNEPCSIQINIVNLLKYFKQSVDLTHQAETHLKNSKIKFFKIDNVVNDFSKIKYMQLKSFLGYGHNFQCKFVEPVLQFKKIKNYEQILNSLSNTEYYSFLK